jgi:phosphoglucosamine mutase
METAMNGTGRILVRYSGTESRARIMIEGPDRDLIAAMAQELADIIRRDLGA